MVKIGTNMIFEKRKKKEYENKKCSDKYELRMFDKKLTEKGFSIYELTSKEIRTKNRVFLDLDEQLRYYRECSKYIEQAQISIKKSLENYYCKHAVNNHHIYISQLSSNDRYFMNIASYFDSKYENSNVTLKGIFSNLISYIATQEQYFMNLQRVVQKETFRCEKGIEGERRVNKELELFSDNILNLQNIRLEQYGSSVECDNVLITDFGIFALEVKNIGDNSKNMTIIIHKDGQWEKQIGNKSYKMDNITLQHNRHIGIMQRFMNEKLTMYYGEHKYEYIKPIIVIANDNINIRNFSNITVIRRSNIYHSIVQGRQNNYSSRFRDEIADIFRLNSKYAKKYPVRDIKRELRHNNSVLENRLKQLEVIEYAICSH